MRIWISLLLVCLILPLFMDPARRTASPAGRVIAHRLSPQPACFAEYREAHGAARSNARAKMLGRQDSVVRKDAPCPVYLELGAAASAGNKYFIAGNIHSDAVTLYSVLLGSDDAGHSWREVYQRIRAAGLDHLQFLDAQSGWAGGQQLFPLPQDPFVLLTTDGGKNWRQSAVFGENSDYHFGSIQEMYFSSKTNGSLVVDRSSGGDPGPFALYESPDGGTSWTH